MKKMKMNLLVFSMCFMALLFTSCGSKSYSDTGSGETSTSRDDMASNEIGVTSPAYEPDYDSYEKQEENGGDSNYTNGNNPIVETSRKLVRKVTLNAETLQFDETMDFINKEVSNLNGYMEQSEIYGNEYYDSSRRSARFVIRIPSDQLDYFLGVFEENTNVINRTESTTDITLEYTDTQSHINALEIEQERLLSLLEKANKLVDIIALEERLSSVRYQLGWYESTLRTYENQVDYSTVTISLNEVEEVTVKTEKNFFEKIGSGFIDSLASLGNSIGDFTVWFIVNIPYFVFLGIIITIGLFIYRKIKKKK